MTNSRLGGAVAYGMALCASLILAAAAWAADPPLRDIEGNVAAAAAETLMAPACDSVAAAAAQQDTDFKRYVELHEWALGAETGPSPMPWRDLNAIAN